MSGAGQYRGVENVGTLPADADRLGELALEAGIPAGVLNGYRATAQPQAMRWFVIMTYVRVVHRRYGHRAQHHEKRRAEKYSMELGGKSPVLIFEDADMNARWTLPCSPSSRSTASAARRFAHLYSAKHLPGIR